MALTRNDEYSYGESQADIREELAQYSQYNAHPIHHCKDAVCECGSRIWRLDVDDTEGVAVRKCAQCGAELPIADSAEYLEEAELESCECPCGASEFEVTVGVSLFPESDDVRWLYLGCRCPKCGLTACYGDWKIEYSGYQNLLSQI